MTGALVGIGYKAVRALLFHPEVWPIALPILAVTAVAYGVEQHRENVAKEQAASAAQLSE